MPRRRGSGRPVRNITSEPVRAASSIPAGNLDGRPAKGSISYRSRELEGPFALSAPRYYTDGWSPIPARRKKALVRGYTGRDGRYPDLVTVEKWARRFRRANVALRLPEDVIGIDVDAYTGKAGAATLVYLEWGLGPLPAT